MRTIEEMRAEMESLESEARALAAKYPGVRPGWVSTDLSLLWAYAHQIRDDIERRVTE
jgi:hypothetical protein